MATTPNGNLGGYTYNFVSPPSDILVCKICLYPSREPQLSVCCGHTFCKSCLEAIQISAVSQACPICQNDQEKFVTYFNIQVDLAIRRLHVFCPNKDTYEGCKWQGEVKDVTNHLENSNGCRFQVVTCPNKCGTNLQRRYMTDHAADKCVCRKVDCQYCHITGEHQFIEGEHKEQCPKFPIACSNKCQADNILRENIDEHKKMCPLEKVTCPNDCGISLQQQYLTSHVEDECVHRKVDCQYCHLAGEHQFIEGEHKEQCPKFPIDCPNKCDVGCVPRDDVEEHMLKCPLELIRCEYHVVGCEEKMARKDQKKHNKEKMEDHLSFITHQLINAQHHSTSGLKKLTAKITKLEKELTATNSLLSDAFNAIDQLIQRMQNTEKDAASYLKNELSKINMRIECAQKEFEEKLATAGKKLESTERDLITTKQQLVKNCQNITKVEQERIKLAADTDEALGKLEAKFQTKITEIETTAQNRITELENEFRRKLLEQEQENERLKLFIGGISRDTLQHYSDIITKASKLSSGDQVVPVIVKFTTKRGHGNDESCSKPFFTHHMGYKMCLMIYFPPWFMASSTRSYMSVYLYLMRGRYDDQLRWPLNGRCEVKLLNQISNSDHHLHNGTYEDRGHKRVTSMERNYQPVWCSRYFISLDGLQKITPTCQYLKDDSIFLKVEFTRVE